MARIRVSGYARGKCRRIKNALAAGDAGTARQAAVIHAHGAGAGVVEAVQLGQERGRRPMARPEQVAVGLGNPATV